MQELISVTTRTIRNRMHKDFKLPARKPLKKTPDYTKNGPSKGLNFLPLQRLDKRRLAESGRLLTNPPSYSLLPANPSFADHMDLHQRTHGTSNQTVKHPPSVMVWGCFSSQGRGGLYFLAKKNKQRMPSRNISVLDDHLQSNFDTMPPFGDREKVA